ncbi:MAG: hypothetical protein IKE91_03680 [Clostridia bacterium]|nr:hypothetical protein [Clostridia bacterium]
MANESIIKSCVESRKNAIYSAYEINNEELKVKIDDLFTRIESFADGCSDATDFETKFAASELNQEYINLFTEIATLCSPIIHETVENPNVKSDAQYVADEVKSEMEYQMKEMTMPARRAAREAADQELRRTPIVGDVIQAKQTLDLFGKLGGLFKKKDKNKDKDKKEEQEENNNE